jgi:hypothetical protein
LHCSKLHLRAFNPINSQVLADPHAPRTVAADVYAFGVVLLEIIVVGGHFVWLVAV